MPLLAVLMWNQHGTEIFNHGAECYRRDEQQREARNTAQYILISGTVQPPVKFQSFADHCRHLIMVSER
jgi:hypothetical protein